jgi:hypothetical protein
MKNKIKLAAILGISCIIMDLLQQKYLVYAQFLCYGIIVRLIVDSFREDL